MKIYTLHPFFATLFLILVITKSQDSPCTPTQIHLSLGDLYYSVSQDNATEISPQINTNQAYLVWHSQDLCTYFVSIKDPNGAQPATNTIAAYEAEFSYDYKANGDPKYTGVYNTVAYTALLHGLEYGKLYEYDIVDVQGGVSRGPFTFRLTTPYFEQNTKKLIVLGDIDAKENGIVTINRLKELTENKYDDYAGILMLGDIAYDLQDDNGLRGDEYFKAMEPLQSRLPSIMALGNHDNYADWSFVNLRIRNPLFNMTQNHYYSFNWEGIHFTVTNFDFYDTASPEKQKEMFNWIENDLRKANRKEVRAQWPWIVFIVHRPIYCSYQEQPPTPPPYEKWCFSFYGKRQIWDELLHKYSVDLVFEADKHSYERMGPLYQNKTVGLTNRIDDPKHHNIINPSAAVFIMNGASGNSYYTPKPYTASGYTLFADVRPSYGILYAQNNTGDMRLIYEHHDSATDKIIDHMNLIRTKSASDDSGIPISKNDGGSGTTILLALCVIGFVGVLAYWYWRKRQQEMETQRDGYFRASERDIPMLVLKE